MTSSAQWLTLSSIQQYVRALGDGEVQRRIEPNEIASNIDHIATDVYYQ